MKIYLVTFADENFKLYQNELENKAMRCNFHGVYSYTKEWLNTTDFYEQNKNILDQKRGCGYYLWKPYIILETLKKINYGDIVFYLDCGDFFEENIIDFIIQNSSNDYVFCPGHPENRSWCKKDCFVLMDCDSEKYWNGSQIEAGIVLFKKTKKTMDLVNEWLTYCLDENILTDIPDKHDRNGLPFKDHRHDQSVLSNLVIKYGLPVNNNFFKYVKGNING